MSADIEMLQLRVSTLEALTVNLQTQVAVQQGQINAAIADFASSTSGVREQMAEMLREYDKGTADRVNAVLRENARRGR